MRPASLFREDRLLNKELLEAAKERVSSIPVLINMVSKRVRQLNAGFRPYVRPAKPDEEKADIALREIAEGKLIAEIDFSAPSAKEEEV
jgi:DNA-directed RNA polymerase subunit omega